MPASEKIPRSFDRRETAEILGVKPDTLAAWSCRGTVNLPFVRIGGRVRYLERDIAAFIEANRVSEEAAL